MGGRHSGGAALATLALVSASAFVVAAAPSVHAVDGRPGSELPTWAKKVSGLLAYVPESYRASCDIFDTTVDHRLGAFSADVVASVRCSPPSGADLVFYTEFDDVDVMDEAFDAFEPSGDSGGDECPDTGTWDQDGVDAGRWACYFSDDIVGVDDAAVITWTHDDTAILAIAARFDDDTDALDGWWESDEAGPLAGPTSALLPAAVVSTEGWRRNAADMKRSDIPPDERASCRVLPLSADGVGAALYRRRLWLLAAVQCQAAGIESVSYYRFSGDSSSGPESPMEAFFRVQVANEIDEEEPARHRARHRLRGIGDVVARRGRAG